jgi:anaerobic nitric oxide reductase flavorubredoxin
MVLEIMENVYWVGVVDWALRHFHGYELSTPRGSTYNSYLIKDEKTVLVDTAWGPFADDFLARVREVVDPAAIDIVVANHAESDHSGSLPAVMRHCPEATVVVSRRGAESIPGHYHQDWNFKVVGTGDKINIGRHELVFVEAPMLHWPDSMFTYLAGKNLLMPNDAFGQHYATDRRFNDEVDQGELYEEALRYYANILTPFSDMVIKKIDEVLALGLPVDMIAPSHGVIWRDEPLQIVDKYKEWAAQKGEERAVVLYDTMWQGTRHMAEAVGAGLGAEGVPYKIFYAPVAERNRVLTEIFRAKAVVVGSPTVNRGYISTLGTYMEDLRGLAFKNKVGAAFGSYGWSGEAVKIIEEHLERCKIAVAAPGVRAKWQPTPEDLAACAELGRAVGRAVKGA